MTENAYYSAILDRPAADVWEVVRDFNSYPAWVNGVDDSYIEEDLPGTAVGCVRNFAMGGSRTRQRLVAHSDVEHFFTYESLAPFELTTAGTTRTIHRYAGTLRIRPVLETGGCFAEWSTEYECPNEDAEYWADWWAAMLPAWLGSLRDHVRPRNPFGVPDVPEPDGDDVLAFAAGAGLSGGSDDDNAAPWNDGSPASVEGDWSSRWNGEGFDWQPGHGRLSVASGRVYILFDWNDGTGQGLIDAGFDGPDRLVGRYLNLTSPDITRPWVGRIVDPGRIDGRHSGGRIDFRR
ncbi:MAG TPA: SRPBCC family protein [Mycobacteriales bacterium]|nr:SRPBCC family protein [Mycobacteriales bacterium]